MGHHFLCFVCSIGSSSRHTLDGCMTVKYNAVVGLPVVTCVVSLCHLFQFSRFLKTEFVSVIVVVFVYLLFFFVNFPLLIVSSLFFSLFFSLSLFFFFSFFFFFFFFSLLFFPFFFFPLPFCYIFYSCPNSQQILGNSFRAFFKSFYKLSPPFVCVCVWVWVDGWVGVGAAYGPFLSLCVG